MQNLKRILIVVGTRPNFIKVTRFKKVSDNYPGLEIKFVHTGQHFDEKMSKIFFEQFGLQPDYMLNIGSGSPNTQMAAVMTGLEKVIIEYKPDLLMVVGDVNSTFAASLTANKMGIRSAHLESGLRSEDRTMPEEINRLLTDLITDYYFVTEQSGIDNLKNEGIPDSKIFFVGNTMIDSLVEFEKEISKSEILDELKLSPEQYVLMTMHRPSNVDEESGLKILIGIIKRITKDYDLVFPIHPRTISRLKQFNLWNELETMDRLVFSEPMDYFSFQKLVSNCKFVVTDSGGIQEETTFCGIPCLTLRNNTERPSTVVLGTNELVAYNIESVSEKILQIENGTYKKGTVPPLWDGRSTERILEILNQKL